MGSLGRLATKHDESESILNPPRWVADMDAAAELAVVCLQFLSIVQIEPTFCSLCLLNGTESTLTCTAAAPQLALATHIDPRMSRFSGHAHTKRRRRGLGLIDTSKGDLLRTRWTQSQPVAWSVNQVLLCTEVEFGRYYGRMSERQLNLFQPGVPEVR
jgi:hypothetical protein